MIFYFLEHEVKYHDHGAFESFIHFINSASTQGYTHLRRMPQI
jgi:hypothetical protein